MERERTRDRDDDERHRTRDYDHKRMSGFDMAPPTTAMLPGTTAAAGTCFIKVTAENILAPQAWYKRFADYVSSIGFSHSRWVILITVKLVDKYASVMSLPGQVPGTKTNPAIPGMFPNMFPLASGQFGALPVMPVQAMTQQATRHARRWFLASSNEQSVATFFSHVMSAIGGNTAGPGDAVVNVYINYEKKFAFIEMRSVEEASNAMASYLRVHLVRSENPVITILLWLLLLVLANQTQTSTWQLLD
ncbi:hypothetical protein K7X08_033792 [Anisodus acutangulus]|uniref:Uncharacterized protein n=1 Tax=Anisodus acutangulus TaxID=402998 RepID=A0A9Q1M5W4_9SOLA|nr:hypothetical protein K7X08_033792 [Anisodus acutangulus]